MNVLLLGAGGFIGSHIVEALIEQGHHRIVGADLAGDKLKGIEDPSFTFHQVDLVSDDEFTNNAIAQADTVVDLISYANPSIYVNKPLDVFELNFQSNLRVLERCAETGTRLVQYSTAEVYGRPSGPAYVEDESDLALGPVNKQRWIYAASKQLLERVIHAYGLEGRLEYTIVRPFNFLGSRLDYLVAAGTTGGPRVFSHYMSALLTGGPMYLVNGGIVHRSFTHIEDANDAFLMLLDHPSAANEIFNVGNPANDTTIRGFAKLMCEVYEDLTGEVPQSPLVEIDGDEFYGPGYQDTTRVVPDIKKMRSLGWEPSRDLRTAIRDAMQYYLDFDLRQIPGQAIQS